MREDITIGKKIIGYTENNEFHYFKEKKKHLFRIFNGYGISLYLLEKIRKNSDKIIFHILDTNERLEITIEDLKKNAKTWRNGEDLQYVIGLEHLKKN
jgi:hypothetical protein